MRFNQFLLTIKTTTVIIFISLTVLCLEYSTSTSGKNQIPISEKVLVNAASPNIQVNYWIVKYCKEEDVPERFVRRGAKQETAYAVLDFSYNPFADRMVSSGKARGPLQILNICARDVWGDSISTWSDQQLADSLRYNIEFNVHTGIRYMAKLYKQYGDWTKVFSVYNQGVVGARQINHYAIMITRSGRVGY